MSTKSIKELLILHFLNDGVRTAFVAILPFIAKDLKLNLAMSGFLGSSQPMFHSILAIPAGFLAAKFGGFKLLTSLLIIYSLAAILTAFSPNVIFVSLAFLLGALGFGMFHTIGFSLVAKISKSSQIGKNMGEFTSIGDIGRVTIPPAVIFLVSILGWRISMIILSSVGFFVYILLQIFKVKKDFYQPIKFKETHYEFVKNMFGFLKNRRLLLTMSATISDALASSPVVIFLPFLVFNKGLTVAEYGIITGAFFAGSLAGRYFLGRGVDKLGNAKVFILSESLMAASLILLTFLNSFFLILIISILVGMFTKGTAPVIQTMMSEVSHKMHYDKIYALSELFLGFAAMVTIIAMGALADKLGIYFVFYACAVLAIIAIIPVMLLSKSKLTAT